MKYLVWVLPLVVTSLLGYKFHSAESIGDIAVIENDIVALEESLEVIDSGHELYPTIDSWMKLRNMADKAGLELKWIEDSMYKGRHHAYSGELLGTTKYVLAIVGRLQADIPIVIHDLKLIDAKAIIRLSVIGVNK